MRSRVDKQQSSIPKNVFIDTIVLRLHTRPKVPIETLDNQGPIPESWLCDIPG